MGDHSYEAKILKHARGTIRRGYIQFAAGEGSQIINFE
jgi:hypothetical protein